VNREKKNVNSKKVNIEDEQRIGNISNRLWQENGKKIKVRISKLYIYTLPFLAEDKKMSRILNLRLNKTLKNTYDLFNVSVLVQ